MQGNGATDQSSTSTRQAYVSAGLLETRKQAAQLKLRLAQLHRAYSGAQSRAVVARLSLAVDVLMSSLESLDFGAPGGGQ
jgi:hypothetical protein